MRAGRESGYRDRRSAGPGGGGYSTSPGSSLGSVRTSSRRADPPSPNHAYQMHPNGSGHGPPMQIAGSLGSANVSGGSGVGGMTANIAYLSPPLDSSWRRTHSDSALHQATIASGDAILNTSPNMSRRGINSLVGI